VIKGELARVKAKLRKSRLGEFLLVILISIVCNRDVPRVWGLYFCQIYLSSFGFLEYSRNRLAVTRDPSSDTSYRPSFLGFLHEPPGGRG